VDKVELERLDAALYQLEHVGKVGSNCCSVYDVIKLMEIYGRITF